MQHAVGNRTLAWPGAPKLSPQNRRPHPIMQAFPNLRTLFKGNKGVNIMDSKQSLLEAIEPLQRGLTATPSDVERIEGLVVELEGRNPTAAPVTSPLLNGQWELLYTTSDSILGRSRPSFLRPKGPIYQTLDNESLRGKNRETTPLFNAVEAELEPISDSEVAVQFKRFWLAGFIPVPAPASARGRLDTTYLDEDLRISRGDKGNLFVLRMNDKNAVLR